VHELLSGHGSRFIKPTSQELRGQRAGDDHGIEETIGIPRPARQKDEAAAEVAGQAVQCEAPDDGHEPHGETHCHAGDREKMAPAQCRNKAHQQSGAGKSENGVAS